jgi:hypothetical protein
MPTKLEGTEVTHETFDPSVEDYVAHYRDYIEHIQWLMEGMGFVINALILRMLTHDRTKIQPPELEVYAAVVPAFKELTFGTPEHEANGKRLGPAWQHHTQHNRHHPQHFEGGIDDMTLIDLIEMVCDWRAAALRQGKFDVNQSLDVLRDEHRIGNQLAHILENTGKMLDRWCGEFPRTQRNLP